MSGSVITYAGESPSKSFGAAAARPRKRRKKLPPPFSIRFTDEERAQLDRDAGALSLAAYMRLKLFADCENTPKPRKLTRKIAQPSAELAVLGHMLGGLGKSRLASNLNQIAKAANMGALPVTPELEAELSEACTAILDMRQRLISAMGIKAQ
jgi:hypothetical protein